MAVEYHDPIPELIDQLKVLQDTLTSHQTASLLRLGTAEVRHDTRIRHVRTIECEWDYTIPAMIARDIELALTEYQADRDQARRQR